MTLVRKPFTPATLSHHATFHVTRSEMPESWLPYCGHLGAERIA
jgi:hypothetical protein